jgi:hypothetical protein
VIVDVGHTTEEEIKYSAGTLLLVRMSGQVERKKARLWYRTDGAGPEDL